MASRDKTVFTRKTYVSVLFMSACCFAAGVLLLWGRL